MTRSPTLGVSANCDWWQKFLVGLGLNASVSCAPRAGWFLPGFAEDQADPDLPLTAYPYWAVGTTDPDYEAKTGILLMSQSTYLPPECINGMGEAESWKCSKVHVLYRFMRRPGLVVGTSSTRKRSPWSCN